MTDEQDEFAIAEDEANRFLAGRASRAKATPKRSTAFRPKFVQLPVGWVKALRQTRMVSAYQLAVVILMERFKQQYQGGEIVLSSVVTGMGYSTRSRAAAELVRLRLIRIEQTGCQAVRVVKLLLPKTPRHINGNNK
jgi:hypothetical protein